MFPWFFIWLPLWPFALWWPAFNFGRTPSPSPSPQPRLPAAPAPRAAAPAGPDDLEIIEGIGPKIAAVLRQAGITTFARLAATSVPKLEQVLAAAKVRIAFPATWPQQAALAAAGKWDELARLTAELKAGRRG